METTNDSFQNRLEEAAKHLAIQPDQLKDKLAQLGIEDSPDVLDILANPEEIKLFGELRAVMPEAKNIPLRLAVNALAGTKNKQTQGQPDRLKALQRKLGLPDNAFNINHVDIDSLLREYRAPDNMHDPVTAELKRRFGERRVILFRGNEVAIDETIDYAMSVEKGMPETSYVMVSGEPVEPVMIGVVPSVVLDEDPLFHDQPLWNQRSRKNNTDYTNIPQNVRQFIRLIVDRREIDVNKRLEVSALFAELKANPDIMISKLAEMFPETYLVFKKASEDGSLPQLKVRPGDSLRKQNPFGNRRV